MIKTLKFKSNFLDNKILADIFFENLVYDWKLHSPICDRYKFYEDFFKSYYLPHQTKKISKLYIGKLGYFKFPYFKMGKISSYHLLGLDELIIFAFYKHLKNKKVKKVADLGANIGMHSLVLDRLGYKVKSFEPDIKHISLRPLLRLCSGVKRFYNCLETFPSDLDLETDF